MWGCKSAVNSCPRPDPTPCVRHHPFTFVLGGDWFYNMNSLSCLLPKPLYRLGDGNSDMQWYSVYELSLLPSTRAFVWKGRVWPQVQTKLNYRLNWTTNAGVELRIWLKQGKEKRLPTRKKMTGGTPEVRSDKSLALLTLNIWHSTKGPLDQ